MSESHFESLSFLSWSHLTYLAMKPVSLNRKKLLTTAILLARTYSSHAFVCDITSPLINTDNRVFVVNTCSQGIGHEFTRQLLSRSSKSARVIGLHRSLSKDLSSLHSEFSDRLSLVPIDIESQASIDQAALQIRSLTNHVDLLINAAGVLGGGKTTPGPERGVNQIDRMWLEKTMQVGGWVACVIVSLFLYI